MLRKNWKHGLLLSLGIVLGVLLSRTSFPPAWGGGQAKEVVGESGSEPKPATAATKTANADFAKTLPFADKRDFDLARRGKIADLPDGGVVKNAQGQIVWDTVLATTSHGLRAILSGDLYLESAVKMKLAFIAGRQPLGNALAP